MVGLEVSKGKLICKSEGELGMLKHMIEAQELDFVFCGMDLAVTVLEVALDDKGRGISGFAGTCVIGTGVATFGQDVGDVAICGDNLFDEVGESGINKVSDDADALGFTSIKSLLDVASHVLLKHSLHITACLLVTLENGLRAKQAAFFGTVPVEFDRVLLLTLDNLLVQQENSQSLQNGDSSRTIIIGAGSSEQGWKEEIDGILVGSNNNSLLRLARNGGDDGVLSPSMFEVLDTCTVLHGTGMCQGVVNLAQQPA